MARTLIVLAAVAAVLTGVACKHELSPAERQKWHADSINYVAELELWKRDSSVIDSLVQLVPTDSIRSLYRAMIRSVAPMRYPQLIQCETRRIEDRFGPRVAMELEHRAKNEAVASVTAHEIELMNRRLPAGMGVEIMGPACGFSSGPGPDSIAGVSMRDGPPKPAPPPRP